MTVCNQNRVNCALVQSYLEYFMHQKKGNESIDEEKSEKDQLLLRETERRLLRLIGLNGCRSGSDEDHQKQRGL